MATARTVRPTDLVALVAYDGRVYPNEAVTRDRLGTDASPHPLEAALEQWFSFATGRHTWISVKGATLRGLVSARKRGSKAAWELDCLIDAAEEDESVVTSLLEQVVSDAGRAGAEKVFLRVPAGSDVIPRATASGFMPYVTERLMVLRRHGADGAPPVEAAENVPGLRRWSRADAHGTFRLYNLWTPEHIRRTEATTFKEWVAASERLVARANQRVIERDGHLVGWVRSGADGDIGRFDVMADPASPDVLDRLIDAALARLAEQPVALTLVPEFAGGLLERLERRGFAQEGEFTSLAQRTTVRVEMPELAPASPATTSVA
jgi:hypothetical protein